MIAGFRGIGFHLMEVRQQGAGRVNRAGSRDLASSTASKKEWREQTRNREALYNIKAQFW